MGALRIALAQINPTVGDLAGNAARIAASLGEAKERHADLVTFPELALCGYPPEDLLLRPHFLQDCRAALDEAVEACEGITALVGFPEAGRGKVFNAVALVHDRRLLGVYHKLELPNYGVFDEKRYFTPGSGCLVFEMNGVRLFATICEDVWVEGGMAERYARKNQASVVLNLSASPFHAGKLALRREVLAAFARRTGAFVCYNNIVGGQDELVFDGGGLVIGPSGEIVASAARFREDLLLVDIAVAENGESVHPRQTSGRWERRIVLQSGNSRGAAPLPPAVAPPLGRLEEVYAALALGTRDYVLKNGFKKAAIGLSGGVDSSLTACIAADALGRDNVIGVTMPSHYTSSETLSDAILLAGNLGIGLLTVPILPIFETYLESLRDAFGPGEPGIECENLQARIRGNILMALSNRFGWLVLTTGNKSEIAVGYCTLYGDTAGGFAVIKDVPKTAVYELADYVNRKAGRLVIPRSVIARAPTAELRPNQKDEDSLPPYAVLDPIVRAYVEEDKAPEEIAAAGFDAARVQEVVRLIDRSEYKRRQAPPGVKITPKAFGRDRRIPITNRYGNDKPARRRPEAASV
jgi:NAD+ synthase (glutamine-hydrolysing)